MINYCLHILPSAGFAYNLLYCFDIIMSKLKEEDEQYSLNGWEDKEDNQPYGAVYVRRLQQKIQQVNNKLSVSAKLPYRTHLKKKSREIIPPKINDISHLKRDREFLQQYLCNNSEPQTHRTFLQENLPQCKAKTMVCDTRLQTHQQHRSSQIDLRLVKCPEMYSMNVSEKQLLFCGLKKEKKKRRKYLVKLNKLEQSRDKPHRAFPMRKRLIMSQTNKEAVANQCKFGFERVIKKGLKFPLFYREVNNKEHSNNTSKNNTLNSLHKKESMREMNGQFTDDNIFETKFNRV